MSNSVSVTCDIVRETDEAILINAYEEQYWIPMSQVEEIHKPLGRNTDCEVVMTRWIAEKKGLN